MSDLDIPFKLRRFIPSESGWVLCTLTGEGEWDVYGLLGWAEITTVESSWMASYKTVVPVPIGAQGEGELAVMYEPSERFRIHYAPALFMLVQVDGPVPMTTATLTEALAQEAVNA